MYQTVVKQGKHVSKVQYTILILNLCINLTVQLYNKNEAVE